MEIMTAIGAMPTLDLVALAAVALIGLPHGALDGAIAMHLGLVRRPLVFVRFLLLYIGMAGLVVVAPRGTAARTRGSPSCAPCDIRQANQIGRWPPAAPSPPSTGGSGGAPLFILGEHRARRV